MGSNHLSLGQFQCQNVLMCDYENALSLFSTFPYGYLLKLIMTHPIKYAIKSPSIHLTGLLFILSHSFLGLSSQVDLPIPSNFNGNLYSNIPIEFQSYFRCIFKKNHTCFPVGMSVAIKIRWIIHRQSKSLWFHDLRSLQD